MRTLDFKPLELPNGLQFQTEAKLHSKVKPEIYNAHVMQQQQHLIVFYCVLYITPCSTL